MESKRSKYILLGLTLLCVLLIGVSSLREGIMDPLRTGVGYLLVPIQSGVNAVGAGIYEDLTDYAKLKTAQMCIRDRWSISAIPSFWAQKPCLPPITMSLPSWKEP